MRVHASSFQRTSRPPASGRRAKTPERARFASTLRIPPIHVNPQTKVKRSGKGGRIMETRQGDDYTRDLGGLGYAQVDDGREKGFYREP